MIDDTCTSEEEEEERKIEYDITTDVYDFPSNYSKCKLAKVSIYYIRRRERHISKIKDLKKTNFALSSEHVEIRNQIIHYQMI